MSRTPPLRLAAAALTALALTVSLAGCTLNPIRKVIGPPLPPGASGGGTAGGGSGTGGSGTGAASLNWQPCPADGTGAQCTLLTVPLNYAKPGGRKIQIALSKIPATAPASQQQGYLLVNPGGPGASGLSLAGFVAQGLDPTVASQYTIIGFDPRGVGSSVPALDCDQSFFSKARPDYIPASTAAEQVLEQRAKTYAQDCEQKFGWLLPYMTTVDSARDMDSIRAALGASQISYYAYSYGTYLGQVYATLFPSRVRRMVLDSTVDPTGVWWADNFDQDYAFQGRQQAFYAWMASNNSTYHLGSTAAQVSASYYKARAQLAAHPIQGANGPEIGPDELDDTVLTGGYDDAYWPGLASALSAYLLQGSSSQLVTQYQQEGVQPENEFAVYLAVECTDAAWPRSWATWDSETRKVYQSAPFEAWDNTWFNASCAYWPVTGPAKPLQIKGAGLPPILMLQGTLDAATPYAGALKAHSLLPSSRMVVVQGGGNHGQSLDDPPNTCVDGYLNRYLATGAVPQGAGPVNATCQPTPPPAP